MKIDLNRIVGIYDKSRHAEDWEDGLLLVQNKMFYPFWSRHVCRKKSYEHVKKI